MWREGRVRKLKERLDNELRDEEGRGKERKELEKKVEELVDRMELDKKETESMNAGIKESIRQLEESFTEEKKERNIEERKLQEKIKHMKEALWNERRNREVLEKEMEMDKKVKEVMESEKEMETKVEAAIEQTKILDLDFGSKCGERKQLVEKAVRLIKEKFSLKNDEYCDKFLNGVRVYKLGKCTSPRETKAGMIHTVPVLLVSQCRSQKERLEHTLRNAGMHVAFSGPRKAWIL
jgi:hypothetical protein